MFASLVFIFIELTDPQAAPPPRDEAPPMTLMLKSTAPLPLDVAVRSARSSPQIPLFATSPSSPRPRLQAPSDLLHSLPSRLLQTTTASTIDAIGLRLFPPHLGLLTHQTSPSLPFSPSTTPNNCIFFVTRSHPEISCAVGYRDHRLFLHFDLTDPPAPPTELLHLHRATSHHRLHLYHYWAPSPSLSSSCSIREEKSNTGFKKNPTHTRIHCRRSRSGFN